MKNLKKDLGILFFSFMLILGNAPVWAAAGNSNTVRFAEDKIVLADETVIEGHIEKFGFNSVKIKVAGETIKIKNSDIGVIGVGRDLSETEKYRLGVLDGKRFAENKGGNLAVGFLFGLLGTAVVYLTSEQSPSFKAAAGPNKAIVNDINYMRGYEKGAKAKSGGQALIGTAIWAGLIIVLISSATAAVASSDYYYY